MKTLYISDMDGTLLGSDSLVSARSAEIISDLTSQGALITVATARTPATVVPLLSSTATIPPAIVMTGAALWQREPGEFDSVRFIPECDRTEIEDVCQQFGLHPFVYLMDSPTFLSVYHEGRKLSDCESTFYEARKNLKLKHFNLNCQPPEGRQAILCYAIGDHRRIFAAAEELRRRGDLSLSCYYDIFDHSIAHLEMFAPGVSKAAAVMELKSRMEADRVVVFGDNLNDLPMMEVADYAVAVGNAFDEVKQRADMVIGPNNDDSVAKFIKTDFEKFKG